MSNGARVPDIAKGLGPGAVIKINRERVTSDRESLFLR